MIVRVACPAEAHEAKAGSSRSDRSVVRGVTMRGSMKAFLFLFSTALACSALIVTGQQPSAAGPFTAEQANAGRAAFQTNCAGCHGADLMGYPPLAGPAFI